MADTARLPACGRVNHRAGHVLAAEQCLRQDGPKATLHLSQDLDADALLSRDPLALLLGMLLDQQIPMEKAFRGCSTTTPTLCANWAAGSSSP